MDDIQSELAVQIADLLSQLQPDAALNCPAFIEAVQGLIQRGGDDLRDRFTIRKRKRVEIAVTAGTDTIMRAREYFRSFAQSRPTVLEQDKAFKKIRHLVRAVGVLEKELGSVFCDDRLAIRQDVSSSRPSQIIQGLKQTEKQSRKVALERRVWIVLLMYEIERLQQWARPVVTGKGSDRGLTDAIRRFVLECEHETCEEEVKKIRKNCGSSYRQILDRPNGLGLLYLLGTETGRLWEHTLSREDVDCLFDFCEEHLTSFAERVAQLQDLVANNIQVKLRAMGADDGELQSWNHLLSRHFPACNLLALAHAANQFSTIEQTWNPLPAANDSARFPTSSVTLPYEDPIWPNAVYANWYEPPWLVS